MYTMKMYLAYKIEISQSQAFLASPTLIIYLRLSWKIVNGVISVLLSKLDIFQLMT